MSSPPEGKGSQTTEHGTSLEGPPTAFKFFFFYLVFGLRGGAIKGKQAKSDHFSC